MKNIYKTFCLLALSGFVLTSCDEDYYTGDSLIDYTPINATVSGDTNVVVSELEVYNTEDAVVPFTVTLAEISPVNAVVSLEQVGGTAAASDYSVSTVTIVAGTLTGTGYVTIPADPMSTGDKTIQLKAYSKANYIVNDFTMNIAITDDYVDQILNLELAWEGSHTYTPEGVNAEVTVNFCDIDIDLYYYPSLDAGPYNITDGATGACPETSAYEYGGKGLPDGVYYLQAEVWTNEDANLFIDVAVPLTLSWEVAYQGSGVIVADGLTTDSAPGTIVPLAKVTISENGANTIVEPIED